MEVSLTSRPAFSPLSRAGRGELARALRANRARVADAFALAYETIDRWRALARAHEAGRDDYLALHFNVFADYLADYFARGDETFKHLIVGESVKALHEPDLDGDAARSRAQAVTSAQRRLVGDAMRRHLSDEGRAALDHGLADIQRILTGAAARTQRVLLVGDCLFQDIVSFIVPDLMAQGVRVVPEYAASRNVAELRDQLRRAGATKFDLVFFSPFTYEFSPVYAQLSQWRSAGMADADVRECVEAAWREARDAIDLIAELFDCPVHVHNSAAIVREENPAKRAVKLKATARIRCAGRTRMNELLACHVEARNAEGFRHLFVFDEARLVREAGEFESGAYFYKTSLQHPATLGRVLARGYVDLLFVNAWLAKRKLVVCDLDGTLWDGTIGEGPVRHFHERQATLRALKAKGVVLAIGSKNDPANVHWRGGTLGDDDFVYAAIGWEPKVEGLKRIQAALDLKMADYVFIDDRADERELMRSTHPEVLALDPASPAIWRRFALWARLLDDDPGMDRTAMYRQREARKAFVREDAVSAAERAALFASLGLKLTISAARADDLKRVAELINRTNQFNLEGSRTSFKAATAWHRSRDHVIVLGRTSDRFGDMGTTCIAVAHCEGAEMRLSPFVLSCRVFGYGIERGVLNHLRAVARARGVRRIVGRYVETPQNAPCRDFLADNGFVREGDVWVAAPDGGAPPNPAWLRVDVR